MHPDNMLIIGLGTGRSGTTSLTGFLNAQENIYMRHEGKYANGDQFIVFPWSGGTDQVLAYLDTLLANNGSYAYVGDVGMYFLNYVEAILHRLPNVRFICMKRDKNEVVRSYIKWTEGRNHWMLHDGSQWSLDSVWDKAYPKYQVDNKETALNQYWDEYHVIVNMLIAKYPKHVLLIDITDFNTMEGKNAILDFIEYPYKRNILVHVSENSFRKRKRGEFIAKFWRYKRSLIGVWSKSNQKN